MTDSCDCPACMPTFMRYSLVCVKETDNKPYISVPDSGLDEAKSLLPDEDVRGDLTERVNEIAGKPSNKALKESGIINFIFS